MPVDSRKGGGLLSPRLVPVASSRSSWRIVAGVAAVGMALTAVSAAWIWSRGTRESQDRLADSGRVIASSVASSFDEVVERLVGVGGFYQGSEEVTQSEFRVFVANFDPIPGMGGVGFMPVVTPDELDDFEARIGEAIPGYEVFELDEDGDRIPVRDRSRHLPVQWFEPHDAFERPHGFDAASDPQRRLALNRARITGEAAVTSFLSLFSEVEEDGFLVYWPVADPGTGEVVGYTFAPMDLSGLLDAQIPAALSNSVTWAIDDLTTGGVPHPANDGRWSTTLEVGGHRWRLSVAPTANSPLLPDRAEPIALFFLGLSATILASIGAYLYRRKIDTQRELERLRELARAKDQFLASVSHELRTPLTGVLGFAELLSDSDVDLSDEERRVMIRSVAAEAADVAAIIDDLLVAARSELDLLAITKVPVSVKAQVSQVLEASDKAICDRVEVVGDPGQACKAGADPARVRQIVRNLVTNACRYGGERIEVRFAIDRNEVHVDVADDGQPLPDEAMEQMFEPYYRGHPSETQPAALGIGLTISRHLARLMDGDLVHYRENGWNVFRLTLPVATSVEEIDGLELASSVRSPGG